LWLKIIYRSETVAQDQQIVTVFVTIIIFWGKANLYCILFCIWPSEYIFVNCNIVPYSCFPHVLLLHILYIHTNEILQYIITVSIPKTHITFHKQCTILTVKTVFLQAINFPTISLQFSHNMFSLTQHGTVWKIIN
jgi:hypothetical protein